VFYRVLKIDYNPDPSGNVTRLQATVLAGRPELGSRRDLWLIRSICYPACMAFGTDPTYDHDAEVRNQAEIAAEVEASDAPVQSEANVAGETADQPDGQATPDADDIVEVRLVDGAEVDGEPVVEASIAGVVLKPGEATEVPGRSRSPSPPRDTPRS
jgi:hypothetical protein